MTASTLPVRHRWRDDLWFSTDDRIDRTALHVASALHLHMNGDGVCSVGLRRLASLARVSIGTVRRGIETLTAAGWLTIAQEGNDRAVYRAAIPPVADTARVSTSDTRDDQTARDSAPDRVSTSDTPRVHQRHTYPYPEITPTPLPPTAGRPRPRRGQRGQPLYDPSVGRPPPGRPPVEPSQLVERDDGTLWVSL